MDISTNCPHCQSTNVERRGYSGGEDPKQRLVCRDCGKWFRVALTYANEPTWERTQKEIRGFLKADRFIITSAQNNTPIHRPFWQGLQRLAKHYKAQILVVPVLYRNPTHPQDDISTTDAWWPEEVVPYLVQNDVQLCQGIRLLGNVKVAATAVNPLVGLEALSRGDSAVVGHAQVQMRTVATPQYNLPKIMHTTGSTSVKNYSDTKAGVKGHFHHSLGAVVVEKDSNCFHIRQFVGDDLGEFYDLDLHVTPQGVKKIDRIEGLVTGDSHALFHSADVRKATFDAKDSIVNILRPKEIVRHDLMDSYSISHHHRNRPVTNFKKWLTGEHSLEAELNCTADFLEETTPKDCKNIVVASNHNEHVARWLEEADPKQEPWNAIIYHELMLAWLKSVRDGVDGFDPFVHWMKAHCSANCKFIRRDEPYTITDILVSMHGDHGANGARGSLRSLSRMGIKSVVGHTHAPAIEKGCYMVGTSSSLTLEYTVGPSSWLNTHCIIHPNSKRQLVNVVKGKWRKS